MLKPFAYAQDGMHTVQLAPGQVLDVADDLVIALERDGYIEPAEAADIDAAASGAVEIAAPVDIPGDWATFTWTRLRALAASLNGGVFPKDKAAAVALIKAELASRAAS